MASRDLHNNIKVTPAINPGAAITGNSTTDSATIDTQGAESLEFVIQSGTITDGAFAYKLQEGDAANLSDVADVAAADCLGAAGSFAATDDNVVKRIGYKGSKRYVRVRLTQSGATSGGVMGAVAVQGHLRNFPGGGAPTP